MTITPELLPPVASLVISAGIALLAIAVALAVIFMTHRAAPSALLVVALSIAGLMAIQLGLARAGVLTLWNRTPPPILPLLGVTLILTCVLAFSPIGRALATGLPFVVLIGFEVFRLPLELVMHQASKESVMPNQMSFSGDNFDIVTGLTAIPVAWLAVRGHAPRGLLIAWNLLGSVLLTVIVVIAVASTPMFHAFGPDRLNTWISFAPFVWLPGVLVPAALLGHLLIWRKLSLR